MGGRFRRNKEIEDYVVETLGTLMLYGVCSTPKSIYEKCNRRDEEFLRFCEGKRPEQRQLDDLSYLDEIRTLQMTRSAPSRLDMLTTRFSYQEDDVFDALEIGNAYFS